MEDDHVQRQDKGGGGDWEALWLFAGCCGSGTTQTTSDCQDVLTYTPSPTSCFGGGGEMPASTKSKVSSPPPIVIHPDQSRIATITSTSHLLSAPLHVVTGRGAFHPSTPESSPPSPSSTQTYPLGCLWVSQQDARPIERSKDSRLR